MPETHLDSSQNPQLDDDIRLESWLVVDQLAIAPPDFSELLREIDQAFALDPYTSRQRLLGRGYSLLLRGERDKLTPLLPLMSQYAIPARLLSPALSVTQPVRLQSLRRNAATVVLTAEKTELVIDGDVHVVAVFADLSGAVVAKGMKHLLVRHAYQGGTASRPYDEEGWCRAISKAQPVLDLYLLNRQGVITGAVRILPGRFDPDGLGAERTPSAALNLLALISLARNCAGRLTLRSDFGLANLPGCQLETPLTEANVNRNLTALSRFGQLAAQFAAQPPSSPSSLHPSIQRSPSAESNEIRPSSRLPPPPEGSGESPRQWLWPWEDTLGVVLAFVVSAVSVTGFDRSFPWIWQQGVTSGLLPALAAIFLFWRGFAAVHLKRMIENTPVSRIRSLATGMVEVCGRAERCYALVTPVTRIPCIYYRLRHYRRSERAGEWQMIKERSSALLPFWLNDDTGKVLIDPKAADLRPGTREEGSGAGLNNGFFDRETNPDSDEKWVEESIPEGERLYVLGFSLPQRVAGESLHEATVVRLQALKGSSQLRQRFDKNGDGEIDVDEWDEARRVTSDEVAKERLAGKQQRRKQEEALVIGAPPRRSHPFLIAQSLSEETVTRTLWWRALGFFVVGLAGTVWALRQFFHILPGSGH